MNHVQICTSLLACAFAAGCASERVRAPASESGARSDAAAVSQAARIAKSNQDLDRFVSFCNGRGLPVRRDDQKDESCRISAPWIPGVDLDVDFHSFSLGSTKSEMWSEIQSGSPPFVFVNENAGLAMSHIWTSARVGSPKLTADSDDLSAVRSQLVQLFHAFRQPQGINAEPAAKERLAAPRRQNTNTGAFIEFCGAHGLKLTRTGAVGYCYLPPATNQDYEVHAYIRTFEPSANEANIPRLTLGRTNHWTTLNDAAGLEMVDSGLVWTRPLPKEAATRASAVEAQLNQLFTDYRPTPQTANASRPAMHNLEDVVDESRETKENKRTAAFAAFCGRHGLMLRYEIEPWREYYVVSFHPKDVHPVVAFHLFVPGTTAAEMDPILGNIQLAFSFTNEPAGLAMSQIGYVGSGSADKPVFPERGQLIQLFRDYRPIPETVPGVRAAENAPAACPKQEAAATAFAEYCQQHGVSLVWEGGPMGYYRVPAPSSQDFDMVVYFQVFKAGLTENHAWESISRASNCVEFMNLAAGLAMSDIGLRSDKPLPDAAYQHASDGMGRLVQLFRNYRGAIGTTLPAATQPTMSIPGR